MTATLRAAIVGVLLLCSAVVSAAEAPVQRPMSEMNGGCADFGWDLSAELAAWAGSPVAVVAGAEAGGATAVGLLQPLSVTLLPQESVRFAAAPEKEPQPERYGGLLRVSAPADGWLSVAAGGSVWIDLVADGALVPEAAFERQSLCETIHKVVVFPVTQGQVLVVQLSNARDGGLRLMVGQAP